MSKLVGWNIFLEYENDDGTISLVAWNVGNHVSNILDEDYIQLKEEEE